MWISEHQLRDQFELPWYKYIINVLFFCSHLIYFSSSFLLNPKQEQPFESWDADRLYVFAIELYLPFFASNASPASLAKLRALQQAKTIETDQQTQPEHCIAYRVSFGEKKRAPLLCFAAGSKQAAYLCPLLFSYLTKQNKANYETTTGRGDELKGPSPFYPRDQVLPTRWAKQNGSKM